MIRRVVCLIWVVILGGVLAGCGARSGTPSASLPLDAEQPTLLYFYTDN